jgi:zinc transport system substrate-binding protein
MRGIVLFFLLSGMLTACGNNSGDKESVENIAENKTETKTVTEKTKVSEPLHIVTTIKPLQSIVLAILGDQLEDHVSSFQLIPDYSSPHNASFKPSDIRKVSQADIIFRIDEHMEVMLNPLLEKHKDKLISLAEVEGIALIDWDSMRKAKNKILKQAALELGHGEHDHDHEPHEGHVDGDEHESHASEVKPDDNVEASPEIISETSPETKAEKEALTSKEVIAETKIFDSHNHGKQDMHIWTSPKNALLMARKITQELSRLDPENQKIYEKNLDTFDAKLGQESMQITQQLNGKTAIPYIVFHNSWQYFAHEFGIADPIVLNTHEGLTSGAKKLSATRQLISDLNIRCVFTGPDITKSQVDNLLPKNASKEIRVVEIDVLARKIEPNQDAYLGWLNNMGKAISNCLQ